MEQLPIPPTALGSLRYLLLKVESSVGFGFVFAYD